MAKDIITDLGIALGSEFGESDGDIETEREGDVDGWRLGTEEGNPAKVGWNEPS